MTKILFITSDRIGDAVLSTGILGYLARTCRAPEITVACEPLIVDFFKPFPAVIKTYPLHKQPLGGHWRELWESVMRTQWDIVVDLRNSIVSRLILARKRYIWRKPAEGLHKVQQLARLLELDVDMPPAPKLYFGEEDLNEAYKLLQTSNQQILAVGPAASWIGKTWPIENFIQLLNRLTAPDQAFENWKIAVLGAPGQDDIAQKLLNSLPENKRIDLIGKTSPMQAASCISLCSYYIGNDTGLMHCAAASNVPAMGLFGPSDPAVNRPWGAKARYAATPESYDALTDYKGYNARKLHHSLMTSLTVDAVEEAVKTHLRSLS